MKKRNLFLTLGLALTLGAVVAGGLSLNRGEVKKVEAATTASGRISVDLTGAGWASNSNGQNISVYFWDDNDHNGWGSYRFAEKNRFVTFIEYSLDFIPTHMKAVRYDNWFDKSDWRQDPWALEEDNAEYKWNESDDLAFTANGNIVIADPGYCFVGTAYMHGTTGGAWGNTGNLSHVKLNGSNHVEYYNSKAFVAEEKFGVKLWESDWVTSFTLSDFIKGKDLDDSSDDAFFLNGSNQIECRTPGTYSVYFDRNGGSLFITDPAAAAADEFAQYFLEKTNGYCTGSISEEDQTTLKSYYNSLASIPGAQADFYTAEVKRGKGLSYASYSSEALSRYVNMQEEKGYNEFLGLSTHNPTASAYVPTFGNNSNNNLSLVIIIASSIALIAAGSFFVICRRKNKNN